MTENEKNILIIQTSPPGTASTLLINAIYGLINEKYDKKIEVLKNVIYLYNYKEKINIVKSHTMDIDKLIRHSLDNHFQVFVICSEKKEFNLLIQDKYRKYENVLIFDYSELNETHENTIEKIICNIYNKISMFLPKKIEYNKINAINRIIKMNELYETIKDKSFDYIDPFFEIHGSHRNRQNTK